MTLDGQSIMQMSNAIANRVVNKYPFMDREELVSIGGLAACEASKRYQPESIASIHTFVWWRMRGAMLDEVKRMVSKHRRFTKLEYAPWFDNELERWCDRVFAVTALQGLRDDDRRFILRVYLDEVHLSEVAKECNVDKSTISRRHARLLKHLQREVRL